MLMTRCAVAAILMAIAIPSSAEEVAKSGSSTGTQLPMLSADYIKGWCAGFNDAAETVRANRDHMRQMLASVKLNPDGLVSETTQIMLKAVDDYVIIPPTQILNSGDTAVGFLTPEGTIRCPINRSNPANK